MEVVKVVGCEVGDRLWSMGGWRCRWRGLFFVVYLGRGFGFLRSWKSG